MTQAEVPGRHVPVEGLSRGQRLHLAEGERRVRNRLRHAERARGPGARRGRVEDVLDARRAPESPHEDVERPVLNGEGGRVARGRPVLRRVGGHLEERSGRNGGTEVPGEVLRHREQGVARRLLAGGRLELGEDPEHLRVARLECRLRRADRVAGEHRRGRGNRRAREARRDVSGGPGVRRVDDLDVAGGRRVDEVVARRAEPRTAGKCRLLEPDVGAHERRRLVCHVRRIELAGGHPVMDVARPALEDRVADAADRRRVAPKRPAAVPVGVADHGVHPARNRPGEGQRNACTVGRRRDRLRVALAVAVDRDLVRVEREVVVPEDARLGRVRQVERGVPERLLHEDARGGRTDLEERQVVEGHGAEKTHVARRGRARRVRLERGRRGDNAASLAESRRSAREKATQKNEPECAGDEARVARGPERFHSLDSLSP